MAGIGKPQTPGPPMQSPQQMPQDAPMQPSSWAVPGSPPVRPVFPGQGVNINMAGIGAKIQADYDELANIANQFMQESAGVEQLMTQINNMVGQLEGGGWIGRGAQAFYAEMHDLVNPGMQRLVRALEDAGGATKQVSNIISQAEQEASQKFSMKI
jgi:WXG100 family type VII secretion target